MTRDYSSKIRIKTGGDVTRLSKKLCAILGRGDDALTQAQEQAMAELSEKIAACEATGLDEAYIQLILAAQAMELIEEGVSKSPDALARRAKSLVRGALKVLDPMVSIDPMAIGLHRFMMSDDADRIADDAPVKQSTGR